MFFYIFPGTQNGIQGCALFWVSYECPCYYRKGQSELRAPSGTLTSQQEQGNYSGAPCRCLGAGCCRSSAQSQCASLGGAAWDTEAAVMLRRQWRPALGQPQEVIPLRPSVLAIVSFLTCVLPGCALVLDWALPRHTLSSLGEREQGKEKAEGSLCGALAASWGGKGNISLRTGTLCLWDRILR